MAGRADLTARTNTALQAPHGSGFCHCVEMEFGTTVAQKPDTDVGDNIGDTSISWDGTALDGVQVFTSLDDGDSWQQVGNSGDPIPYQTVTVNLQNAPIVPVPIGWVTTGKTLQVRVLFPSAATGATVTSVTIHIGYEDTTTFDQTVTGDDLVADGHPILSTSISGGLRPTPDVFLHFDGNGAAVVNDNNSAQVGVKSGLHLSVGELTLGGDGLAILEAEVGDANDTRVTPPSLSIRLPVTITVPGGVCTVSGTSIGVGMVPGQSFFMSGFTNPQNNGFFNALTVSNDVLTTTQTTLIAEGPVTATVKATRVAVTPTTGNRFTKAAMAIEGWIYPETATCAIGGWGELPGASHRATFEMELVGTSASAAQLVITINEAASLFPSPNFTLKSPTDSIPLNAWSHIAFSYDGFWGSLYLDGELVAQVALVSSMVWAGLFLGADFIPFGIVIPTTSDFLLGRSPARHPVPDFTGRMSEWRLYGAYLTAGAIQRRMFRRFGTNEIPLIVAEDALMAYYPMDEGAGETVTDNTGLGNDMRFDQVQPAHGEVGFQGSWLPDSAAVWQGFPVVWPSTLTGTRAPGCQSEAFNIDPPGDIVRLTDATFDVTFADSRQFIAAGGCGQIEAIQEAGDLVPTGVRLTLSGIQPQHLSLALNVRYLDRPCRVYQLMWDGTGTQLDQFLVFEGKMDVMAVDLGKTASVQVSAESALTNWRRPRNLHWSDAGHRSIWPDDNGFEFLDQMVDLEVWWPVRVGPSASSSGG